MVAAHTHPERPTLTRSATLAAHRFGTGLAPGRAPQDAAALLAGLDAPDHDLTRFQITPFAARLDVIAEDIRLSRARAMGDSDANDRLRAFARTRENWFEADLRAALCRAAFGAHPLRERLALFWENHFATRLEASRFLGAGASYASEAIRPHVAGDFATLLRAAVLHPVMLHALDQDRSAGPNSPAAQADRAGLNENLAREVLELHTLGVAGPYAQADVRQMALLLAGASIDPERGAVFDRRLAEPGPKSVLKRSYGGPTPRLADIEAALDDLAHHPATARHIATKLARHFTGPDPDAGLVAAMEAAFNATDGNLRAVYAVLLDHPAAWGPEMRTAKPPFGWIASALRALGADPDAILSLGSRETRAYLLGPLRLMAQPWGEPPGPQGFPDTPAQWITPPTLAARIQWAMAIPRVLVGQPDPRDLVQHALGDLADDRLRFAAHAAESRWEGVGLILSSPAFMRR
jgi:uncharacterized protein (DUF1800 family)